MCGVAGILRVHAPGSAAPPPTVAIPESWLDVLDDSIKHRGPDGKGRFRDRAVRADGAVVDVALVHRRLSIIDHSGGHQPMVSAGKGAGVVAGARARGPTWLLYESAEDAASLHAWAESATRGAAEERGGGSADLVAVAFNGCIYNHRELRRELQDSGHVFSSDHSDTEVLVHGWREWGDRLFERCIGMYATLIWDRCGACVLAFREQSGEKPLYCLNVDSRTVAFASTAAGLLKLGAEIGVPIHVPPEPLTQWISLGYGDRLPCPAFCVAPGAGIRFAGDAQSFAGSAASQVASGDDADSVQRLRGEAVLRVETALQMAVHARLEADAALGCFLSGGIDSGLIAAMARQVRPDLQTFCVRMPDPRADESAAAAVVAGHLRTEHHTLDCDARGAEDVVGLIRQLGLPLGDSSLLPTHWVSRAVSRTTRVALAGDGGDELFAGYDRYVGARLLGRLQTPIGWMPTGGLPQRDPRSLATRLGRLSRTARSGLPEDMSAIYQMEELITLMPSAPLRAFRLKDHGLGSRGRGRIGVDSVRRVDLLRYLPEDLLRKVDTASMAVGLEVRSPMLDPMIRRLCCDLGTDALMPRGERKGLLKQVARRYLPPEIVDRPKQGFAIPIGEWFRSDFGGMRQLLRDHLLGPEPFGPDSLGINAMINMAHVRRMLKAHDDAGSGSVWPWKGRDHSQRLYMLLVLSIWGKWLGSIRRQAPVRVGS